MSLPWKRARQIARALRAGMLGEVGECGAKNLADYATPLSPSSVPATPTDGLPPEIMERLARFEKEVADQAW